MIEFDLVVMKKYSRLKIRQNLRSASCSFGRCRFHRCHSYAKAEIRRRWLTEAGEKLTSDQFQSGHRSDDHPANFANWMRQSTFRHSLSEIDPDFADWLDAVAVLASLLSVTVGVAGQAFAERRADSPR